VIQIGDTRGKIKSKIEKLVNNTAEPRHYEPESILSTREKDVVRLLAKGLSNKEISGKLFISPHTVITHRKNITRKLNIKSVAGLIVYAIINDIVSVDEMQQQ
jgi:DNA-binding CsgD family transcriptional regulator